MVPLGHDNGLTIWWFLVALSLALQFSCFWAEWDAWCNAVVSTGKVNAVNSDIINIAEIATSIFRPLQMRPDILAKMVSAR
jgi:hypothetical protein